jgi:hypothetical protein
MATTIPKNATRQITDLTQRLTRCRVYTLGNHFLGSDVDPSAAWDALARPGARLADHGTGTWTVRVHDNCWYELREGRQPPADDAGAAQQQPGEPAAGPEDTGEAG